MSPRIFVRSRILGLLVAFSFVGYVQRAGVSVAAEQMMPTLGLSQVAVGWLLTAFLIGYTLFQLPGAAVGRRLGARGTITMVGLLSIAATVATCLAPRVGIALAVLPLLLVSRFVLGVAQAALFPVASGAIEAWFPDHSWAFAQGWLVFGMWLGSAAASPAIALLMERWDWQVALYVTSVPSLLLVVVWHLFARNAPREHSSVTKDELAQIENSQSGTGKVSGAGSRSTWALLRNPLLFRITASYFLMNYVFYLVTFWSFLYLVQDKHFSTLEGGWLASIPFLAAAVAAPIGGKMSDVLSARWGRGIGFRLIPLLSLPAGALCLYFTVTAGDPYWAVAALSLAFAFIELTEGPFWAAAMRSAPADSMAATAVLNTGGNLGGIVATPIIAALSSMSGWTTVFATGAVLAAAAAVLWLWIDVPSMPPAAATA
jgi:MFS family permease